MECIISRFNTSVEILKSSATYNFAWQKSGGPWPFRPPPVLPDLLMASALFDCLLASGGGGGKPTYQKSPIAVKVQKIVLKLPKGILITLTKNHINCTCPLIFRYIDLQGSRHLQGCGTIPLDAINRYGPRFILFLYDNTPCSDEQPINQDLFTNLFVYLWYGLFCRRTLPTRCYFMLDCIAIMPNDLSSLCDVQSDNYNGVNNFEENLSRNNLH